MDKTYVLDFNSYIEIGKKYKLDFTSFICQYDRILYQIVALRDFDDVKKGDRGGYIETESNLSHEGTCWVYYSPSSLERPQFAGIWDCACVSGDAQIRSSAHIYGNAIVRGNAFVSGTSKIYDNAVVEGDAVVSDNFKVCDNAIVTGSAKLYGTNTKKSKRSGVVCGDFVINTGTYYTDETFGVSVIVK